MTRPPIPDPWSPTAERLPNTSTGRRRSGRSPRRDGSPRLEALEPRVLFSGDVLWLNTENDVTGSGVPGLDSWSGGTVLRLGDPGLGFSPTTSGTLAAVFNIDDLVDDGDGRLSGLHYVGRDMTVGTNSVQLETGDVLFSTVNDEWINGGAERIWAHDILLFEPTTPGDYSSGTLSLLMDGSDVFGNFDVDAFTLAEQAVTVGTTTPTNLDAGDFLLSHVGAARDVLRFQPGTLGATSSGTITTVVDGSDAAVGIDPGIRGLDVIESSVTVGDTTLNPGQLLMTLHSDDVNVGGVGATRDDIFILSMTDTGAASAGTLQVFFQGDDVNLNTATWQEQPWGLSLAAAPQAVPVEPGLWLTTDNDVSGSGVTGLDSWSAGSVLSFTDPGQSFEPNGTPINTTSGTLSTLLDLDTLVQDGDASVTAIHYVSRDLTVGGGGNTFDLLTGDLILSTQASETLLGTNGNLAVTDDDAFVFRPTVGGDFSGGAFYFLLDGAQMSGIGSLSSLSLVEQDTTVGDSLLSAGTFLLSEGSSVFDLRHFTATGVGTGTATQGVVTTLIDGSDINNSSFIHGVELIETSTTIGGTTLAAGSILLTHSADDSTVGDNSISVDQQDVYFLTVTKTEWDQATTVADATLLFDGSDVALDSTDEDVWGVTLVASSLAPQYTVTVDTTSDTSDGDTSSIAALIADPGSDGRISLREAIAAANANLNNGASPDRIEFEITDALVGGVHTITVGASGLPAITDPVVIDGSTESDYVVGSPVIVLDGAAYSGDGLDLQGASDGSTIRGLTIQRFGDAGIRLFNSDNSTVVGNWIGTGADGLTDQGNGNFGIEVDNSSGVQIGGSSLADRNVIAGNDGQGISLWNPGTTLAVIRGNYIGVDRTGDAGLGNSGDGIVIGGGANNNTIGGDRTAGEGNVISGQIGALNDGIEIDNAGADDNRIYGNFIGTNADGTAAIGNARHGVVIYNGVQGTAVGGTGTGQGNIISGNGDSGIVIDGNGLTSTQDNVVLANYIGVGADGLSPLGNADEGIHVFGSASNNLIGGTSGGGNVIAYNADGVVIETGSDGISLLGNLIFGNTSTGIDLAAGTIADGVSANDTNDGDGGGNLRQNFPVISSAVLSGTDLTLDGTLDTDLGTTQFRIEFFGVADGDEDPTNGEGRYFLGATTVTTDGSGDASFSGVTLSGVTLAAGDHVTAVATRITNPAQVGVDDELAYGRSSEFGANLAIAAANSDPVVTFGGGNVTYVEDDPAVFIDATATVTDADLTDFDGGVLTVDVTANGSGADRIRINNEGSGPGQVGMTTGPNEVFFGGVLVGTWSGSGAPLTITFNASADATAVQAVVRNITFENLSDDPSTLTRTVRFQLTDGDGGTSAAITKGIDLTPVNDAPTFSTTNATPTFTENGSAIGLFSATAIGLVEASDLVDTLRLTVDSIADGSDEVLVVDGQDIELTHLNSETTAANGYDVDVTVAGSTATVLVTKTGGYTAAAAQTLVDGLAYRNNSENPTGAARLVTLTSIRDDGGTANGGVDTTTIGVASLVTITAVNDAPTLSGGPYNLGATDEDTTTTGVQINTILAGLTTNDADGDTLGVAVTAASGNGTWQFSTDSTDGSDGTWTDFGAVAGNSALLLSDATWLRYQPDGLNGEAVSIDFRAWDGTTGSASTTGSPSTADPGTGGGTTAYSTGAATADLTVTDVNDAPTVNLANPVTAVAEDASTTPRIKVADIVVTDDGTGTNVLSLTGADAGLFEIDGTELFLVAGVALDHETNPVLDVTVRVDDSAVGATPDDTAALAITVTDVNEAPTVALTNTVTTLAEDASTTPRIKVADIVVTDDALGTNVLSLTGADAGLFEIDGTELFLVAGASLDHESNPTLDVTVRVNDATLAPDPNDTAALAISVTDVNEAPTVALANTVTSLAENADTSSRIKMADIVVSDDASGTNVLSLADADAGLFEIDGTELFLSAGAALDHETNGTLDVAVRVDDAAVGGTPDDTAALSVTVTDVNDAPTLTDGFVVGLPGADEDSTTAATTVSAIVNNAGWADADAGAGRGMAITAATGNGVWQYSTDGLSWRAFGAVSAINALLLDAGSRVRYVGDGVDGEVPAFDFRAWDTTAGAASTNATPSYAAPGAGGGTSAYSSETASANATINAVNDEQTLTTNTGATVAEGSAGNVVTAAILEATDVDHAAAQLVFTVTGAPAHGTLRLIGTALGVNDTFTQDDINNGRVTYDHAGGEAGADSFNFSVDDGAGTATAGTFAVTVTPVNDAPAIAVNAGLTVDEGSSGNVVTMAVLNEGDPDDAGAGLTFTVTAAPGNGTLRLNGSALGVNDTFTQDDLDNNRVTYDHDGSETVGDSFGFTLADGGENGASPTAGTFTLTVTPQNDPPTLDTNAGLTVGEGASGTITNAALSASDPEQGPAALTYTLTANVSNGTLFRIATPLSVSDTFTQDDLDNNRITYTHDGGETTTDAFQFTVTDGAGGTTGPATFTIAVTPANDAPTITPIADQTIAEDTDTGPLAFTVGDAETAPGALTVTATSGNPALIPDGNLTLAGTDASRTITATPVADAAGGPVTITVRVSDGSVTTAAAFNVTVTAVNDPPGVALTGATTTLAEDTPTASRIKVADIAVTDDGLGTNALGLAGADAGLFEIDGSELFLTAGATLDHESNGVLDVTVQVDDATVGGTPDDTAALAINITDVNEPPTVATPLPDQAAAEDTPFGFTFAANAFADPDAGDTLTYTAALAGGGALPGWLGFDGATRTFSGTPAQADVGALDIRVTATDAALLSTDDVFTLTVAAVDDAPTVTTNSLTVSEGQTVTLSPADLSATDPDTPASGLTFVVTGLTGGRFELSTAPGVAVGSFTPAQVTAGQVRLVHDGGEAAPTYSVAVSDGALSSAPDPAAITFTNVNDTPQLLVNQLVINAGQTVVLGSSHIATADPDHVPAQLTLTATGVAHGRFELVSNPGVAVTAFTQAQIDAGQVRFVHDGAALAPAYDLTVDDGALTDGPSSAQVTFNAGPALAAVTNEPPGPPALPPPPTPPLPDAPDPPDSPALGGPPATPEPDPFDPPPVGAAAPPPPPTEAPTEPAAPAEPSDPAGSPAPEAPPPPAAAATEPPTPPPPAVAGVESGGSRTPRRVDQWAPRQLRPMADVQTQRSVAAVSDQLERATRAEDRRARVVVGQAAAAGGAATVGYLVWLLRGGSVLAGVLTSLPVWRMIDPLSVLPAPRSGPPRRRWWRRRRHAAAHEPADFESIFS